MRLTDIISPTCIKVPLNETEKKEAIGAMVDLLCQQADIADRQELFDAVWRREQTRTTGIGHGVAIPHGKCSGCQKLCVALAKPATPLEFNSIDGKPVDLIILLASPPDQTGPHIAALAAISRLLNNAAFRSAIRSASTAQEIYDLFTRDDA